MNKIYRQTIIEEELKRFDRLIDNLPQRVNETPRDVLKQFLQDSLNRVARETAYNLRSEKKECDICHGTGLIWKDKESSERGDKPDFPCRACQAIEEQNKREIEFFS